MRIYPVRIFLCSDGHLQCKVMKPTISDLSLLVGLALVGTGLFFWFGVGPALSIPGAVVLCLGIAWNIAEGFAGKK